LLGPEGGILASEEYANGEELGVAIFANTLFLGHLVP
jgi:hypothetical protein